MSDSSRVIALGHSPDPDDAFMFYGLAKGLVETEGLVFEHILQDIQTLNERATRGELDITALSVHAYVYVRDQYQLLDAGASMGDGYGPMVVMKKAAPISDLKKITIAIPGRLTSAALGLKLCLGESPVAVIPFDRIIPAVVRGDVAAGLIIHEGQLTYAQAGLECALDLGKWWKEKTGLPMPLGVNAVKRDLGSEMIAQLSRILSASIDYSLTHRAEATRHALQWARDMGMELADRFIGMYVNDLTVDMGERGRRAIAEFLGQAERSGYIPRGSSKV
ncbi:MAG: ABC transporter substrate-binding protein [Candidatus Sumerlaeota bacterium]|nr:ABC transporter substrate-binding protein [Candidatus Sumerlaeota bacterium]